VAVRETRAAVVVRED